MAISHVRLVGYILMIEIIALFPELLVTLKGAVPSHVDVIKLIILGIYSWLFWGLLGGW